MPRAVADAQKRRKLELFLWDRGAPAPLRRFKDSESLYGAHVAAQSGPKRPKAAKSRPALAVIALLGLTRKTQCQGAFFLHPMKKGFLS